MGLHNVCFLRIFPYFRRQEFNYIARRDYFGFDWKSLRCEKFIKDCLPTHFTFGRWCNFSLRHWAESKLGPPFPLNSEIAPFTCKMINYNVLVVLRVLRPFISCSTNTEFQGLLNKHFIVDLREEAVTESWGWQNNSHLLRRIIYNRIRLGRARSSQGGEKNESWSWWWLGVSE